MTVLIINQKYHLFHELIPIQFSLLSVWRYRGHCNATVEMTGEIPPLNSLQILCLAYLSTLFFFEVVLSFTAPNRMFHHVDM